MGIKYNYRGLIDNDVVVLRDGDIGIISNKSIILQSGGVLFKDDYKYSNKAMDTNTNYDLELVSFNITNNEKNLVWKENIPFPELKNGDVVVLNNDEIYMKVDNCLVCQFEGFTYVDHYDENGENISVDGEKWNIKQVYRKDKIKNFEIANIDEYLIWERS